MFNPLANSVGIRSPEVVAKHDKILQVNGVGPDAPTFYVSERSLLRRSAEAEAQFGEVLALACGWQRAES